MDTSMSNLSKPGNFVRYVLCRSSQEIAGLLQGVSETEACQLANDALPWTGENILDEHLPAGATPLMAATYGGKIEAMRAIYAAGANIETQIPFSGLTFGSFNTAHSFSVGTLSGRRFADDAAQEAFREVSMTVWEIRQDWKRKQELNKA